MISRSSCAALEARFQSADQSFLSMEHRERMIYKNGSQVTSGYEFTRTPYALCHTLSGSYFGTARLVSASGPTALRPMILGIILPSPVRAPLSQQSMPVSLDHRHTKLYATIRKKVPTMPLPFHPRRPIFPDGKAWKEQAAVA